MGDPPQGDAVPETYARLIQGKYADDMPSTEEFIRERRQEEWKPKDIFECVLCGHTTFWFACKMVCINCGARRDCSDP